MSVLIVFITLGIIHLTIAQGQISELVWLSLLFPVTFAIVLAVLYWPSLSKILEKARKSGLVAIIWGLYIGTGLTNIISVYLYPKFMVTQRSSWLPDLSSDLYFLFLPVWTALGGAVFAVVVWVLWAHLNKEL